MNTNIFVGTWVLTGSISTNSEVQFIKDRPDPKGVINWLNGTSQELVEQTKASEGLVLTIAQNKKFEEKKTGDPKVKWFNYEGVESNNVEPFDGQLKLSKSRAYLIADNVPSWAMPENRKSTVKLRYDDGDTKIADFLEIINDRLVRTINVVTDELYLDRVIIVYQKLK